MRLLLALLLSVTLAPDNQLTFTVQTDIPRSFYVELDTTGGATVQGPSFYLFSLKPGETFGRTITAVGGLTPGTVRVRVWASDGGEAPVAEQTVNVAARPAQRLYVPLLLH